MKKRFLHITLIIVTASIVFFNTLHNGFHLDDYYRVVDNPAIQTLSSPWQHFLDPSTISTLPRITQYRPFLPLTLSINFWLHKYSLPGYHLVNLLFHIIAGIIVYLICVELMAYWTQNKYREETQISVALVVSILFTIHPVAGILINYVSSRDLILMQMFLLGSFLSYVRMRRLGITPLRWTFVLFLMACSLISKQNGVVAPVLIMTFEFTVAKQRFNDIRAWGRAIPFALLVVGFFAFTELYLGFSDIEKVSWVKEDSFWTYPLTQTKVHLTHYLLNFFWPWFIRQAPYVKPAKSIFEPQVFLGIVFIFATLFVVWRLRKKDPLLVFCILGYWILLAPTSSFLPYHHFAVHYRPYPASHLFFLALALIMLKFIKGKSLVPIAILSILYFSMASIWLNKTWKTDEILWTHSVKYGGEALAHLNLAMSIDDRTDPRVLMHLEKALNMNPNYVLAHINLGLLLIDLGKKKEGLSHCKRAVMMAPNWAQTHYWLSHAYTKVGMQVKAFKSSAIAAKINPRSLRYQYKAAVDAQRVGDYKQSLIYLDACEKLHPGYNDVYFLRGYALQMIGDITESVKYYRMHLRSSPDHIQTEFNLGYELMKQKKFQDAIVHFNRTLELAPSYKEVHLYLANCYKEVGNQEGHKRHLALYNEAIRQLDLK